MDKQTIEVLRRAGDLYAANNPYWQTSIIEALNPYYFAYDVTDDYQTQRRVSEWEKVQSVEHLLSLIEASSGVQVAAEIREKIRFRYEMHESSNTPYIWELDEGTWLLYADLVCIRALEQLHPDPMSEIMTTVEVERQYGLAEGTANKAAQRGSIPAEKRGHDWWIKRTDAEKRWGNNSE